MRLTKQRKIALTIFIVVVLFALYYQFSGKTDLDNFAKCLTLNDVKLYGAYWCHNCNDQKEMFGTAERYLDYIECDEEANKEECDNANIEYYPTWKFPSGKELIGKQELEKISKESGCEL